MFQSTLCMCVCSLTAPKPLGWSWLCVTAELSLVLTGDVPAWSCSRGTCSQLGEGGSEHFCRGTGQHTNPQDVQG